MGDVRLAGAVEMPDHCWVRGRGLRHGLPEGPLPEFGLYLVSARVWRKQEVAWEHIWVEWPDFLLPRDRDAAVRAIRELHRRALDGQRVEVACGGGVGRTGTVMACLATLSGLAPDKAVNWVREEYHPRAVETPWQRRWIGRFAE
ncbi:protein-tyrosine phosphatase family protein [Nonomuraea longicatena]|uniref:Protein-tyrosine phosphatase family protein n=1 Tax=Nonomuraea longicatena TaxID=83682 RepID=A0ABN1PQL9_9ACTN